MDLRRYFDLSGQLQKDLARAVGVSDAQISRLVSGKCRPSAELAEKIEKATGGKVKFRTLMLGAHERAA